MNRITFRNKPVLRHEIAKEPTERRILVKASWREHVWHICNLGRRPDEPDNRKAGNDERRAEVTLFGKFVIRRNLTVVAPYEVQLVLSVLLRCLAKIDSAEEVIVSALYDDRINKCIQLARSIAAKPKLASQDSDATAFLYRFFNRSLGYATWDIRTRNQTVAQKNLCVRVGTACDCGYLLLVKLLAARPVKQHVTRQQVIHRNY